MHSKSEQTSGEVRDGAVRLGGLPAATLPDRHTAIILPWDSGIAKRQGIFGFDSLDPRSRCFNLIRSRLLELKGEHDWRLFGVVSATPNVGKSFITANIAAAVSRDPRFETYAVDLDLRRGSLTETFGVPGQDGINAYLEGAVEAPNAFMLESERLLIMPAQAAPVRSAELLAGNRAQALMRAMRSTKDNHLFFVDLPPVFANDDAATAMSRLDAYIVVAEEGRTTQNEISETVNLLGRKRLAGVILNKYRGGVVSEGYGADSYYAYGYGVDDDSTEPLNAQPS